MNKRDVIGISGGDPSADILMHVLIAAATRPHSKLTDEQRAEIKEKRRLASEERTRRAKIIKNVCPACDSKLTRGKKDKKNDYKRTWDCTNCGSRHTV
ncbi:hypothetical protein [Metabacillus sp. SLBN-84]